MSGLDFRGSSMASQCFEAQGLRLLGDVVSDQPVAEMAALNRPDFWACPSDWDEERYKKRGLL
jgi:hypothetical protein